MKNLKLLDLNQISGGEKTLLITTNIDIKGLPPACIDRFFQNNNNFNLVGVTEDMLSATLTHNCTEYQTSKNNAFAFNSNNIDMRIIEQ